ncbi:calreticulin-like isoform X2 [Alexandromys fortis]|uniref:calreticulin-like isoform X2 n=1 Tax=Alexandromys fortis TaxID=100897 RepID=UPI0021523BA5|nr:calreticulin-like isoform X2 [Microtus fortis]
MKSLSLLPLLLLLTTCTLRAQGKRRQVYFREEFEDGDGWTKRWVQSKHQSDYGKFQLTAGKFYQDKERDKGLQTSEDAKFYALSTRFKPFSNVNETLVVQFSVKHEQGIDCGGGYVKLFPATLNQEDMHSESQYYIMFGPDICGFGNNRLQVIFYHHGKYHENNKTLKCRDWEDSEFIPDPEAKKPDDWNEEIDGVWEGPLIPNAKYKGEWKPRIIDNPNYQGEWIHPEIDNPKYRPDPNICHYYNISVLGLDLWQVKSGSIFDNFLLTNDEEFAEEVGNKTWGLRKDVEQQWRELFEEMEKKKEAEETKMKRERERARQEDIWGLDEEDEEDNEEDSEEEPDEKSKLEDSASLGKKEARFDQKDEL